MRQISILGCDLLLAVSLLLEPPSASAQESSVRPGINEIFQDPDVEDFVGKFEGESREVFDRRLEILAACRIKPGMVVGDIGAGTGLFTRLFSPAVGPKGKVFAVDIASNFIDHIQKTCKRQALTNVTGVVSTPSKVNLPAESLDLAFVCDTYHHFEYPYKTMRSIYAALRPGGQVVLVEFHRIEGVSSEWILEHVRAGQATFVREILLAGFTIVEEPKFLKESYVVRFEKDARRTVSGHTADSLDDVQEMLSTKTATLVDVREQDEWEAGHLQPAVLIPLSQLRADATTKAFAQTLARKIPNDKIIYCHCRSGRRALAAAEILEGLYYDVRPLKAGYDDLLDAGFNKANR